MRRSIEIALLSWAALFIGLNQLALIQVTERPWTGLWPVGVWLVCAVIGYNLLNDILPRHDPYLFPAMMLLAGWGLNLIDRLLPTYTERQATWMILGVLALLGVCALPGNLRWLQRYRYTWLLLGLALVAVTIVLGVNPSGGGPRLWLGFGEFFYQPSEILKILMVAFLASYLADMQQFLRLGWRDISWRGVLPMGIMWGLCVVLLVWQRDLGTASIFFMVFMLMLYVAMGRLEILLVAGVLLALAGVVAYQVFDVVTARVSIWLDPWSQADDRAFQIVQSVMAVSAGGGFGRGIGQGIPTFIPVVHTDFTYAAIAEEWGLVGALGVLLTLLVVIMRGLRLAVLIQYKPFHAYLALGLCALLAVQTALIVGGTLNLIPVTGVTLPFISYGGSSMLTNCLAVGFLLSLSRYIEEGNRHDS